MLRILPLGLLWFSLGCAVSGPAPVLPAPSLQPSPQATFGPPAPTPAPSATPTPDPLTRQPAFGAIARIWKVDNEKERIYREAEDPSKKVVGTAQGHYLLVNGQTYAIHFEYWQTFDQLNVGDTVNLHPTDYLLTVTGADGRESAPRRMWKVFPGSRFVPPLEF
jgi:hypothetical protein